MLDFMTSSFYYSTRNKKILLDFKPSIKSTWNKLEEKVRTAIQDIISYEKSIVSVSRVFKNRNFQVETLTIHILDTKNQNQEFIYLL